VLWTSNDLDSHKKGPPCATYISELAGEISRVNEVRTKDPSRFLLT
jgi:hypothetical protein